MSESSRPQPLNAASKPSTGDDCPVAVFADWNSGLPSGPLPTAVTSWSTVSAFVNVTASPWAMLTSPW